MDSSIDISLEGLPTREAIEKARDDAQAELTQTGSRLARLKWPLLRDAATACMNTSLSEVDPFELLSRGWTKALELRQLAEKTKAAPGTREPYPVGEHSLSASLYPVVTLRCGPLTFPALKFTVTVEGAVKCAVLIIANGRIESVEALTLTPSAILSFGEKELNRIDCKEMPIGDPIKLPNGGWEIPLG